MIRRPPRSTRKESSAASDVYKRQDHSKANTHHRLLYLTIPAHFPKFSTHSFSTHPRNSDHLTAASASLHYLQRFLAHSNDFGQVLKQAIIRLSLLWHFLDCNSREVVVDLQQFVAFAVWLCFYCEVYLSSCLSYASWDFFLRSISPAHCLVMKGD
eukprot:TRINITY_DN12800_c0_g3_i2.p1 TRINITY_DN12800_c0_g3~~TRINITY_DN12800_c0_g3_i2.p1  ORF type:complete len:156 (-),score=9.46 TRINITY_DN12800_c0_g3_i2:198-665(-)